MCHIFLSADSDFGTFRALSCLSGRENGVFLLFSGTYRHSKIAFNGLFEINQGPKLVVNHQNVILA